MEINYKQNENYIKLISELRLLQAERNKAETAFEHLQEELYEIIREIEYMYHVLGKLESKCFIINKKKWQSEMEQLKEKIEKKKWKSFI